MQRLLQQNSTIPLKRRMHVQEWQQRNSYSGYVRLSSSLYKGMNKQSRKGKGWTGKDEKLNFRACAHSPPPCQRTLDSPLIYLNWKLLVKFIFTGWLSEEEKNDPFCSTLHGISPENVWAEKDYWNFIIWFLDLRVLQRKRLLTSHRITLSFRLSGNNMSVFYFL